MPGVMIKTNNFESETNLDRSDSSNSVLTSRKTLRWCLSVNVSSTKEVITLIRFRTQTVSNSLTSGLFVAQKYVRFSGFLGISEAFVSLPYWFLIC